MNVKVYVYIINVVAFLLFFSCSSAVDNNTCKYPSILEQHNTIKLVKHWSLINKDNKYDPPLLLSSIYKNMYIFTAHYYGFVDKIDISTGKQEWSVDLSCFDIFKRKLKYSSLLLSNIVTCRNGIYVGSKLARVYSLSASNGSVIWCVRVAGEVLSMVPVINKNLILVYTDNGFLHALNVSDGSIKWILDFFMPSFTLYNDNNLFIFNDIIIMGNNSGKIFAISVDTGELFWQKNIFHDNSKIKITQIKLDSIKIIPYVKENIVYIYTCNGSFIALDVYSGQVIWSDNFGALHNVLLNNHVFYLVDTDNRISAFHLSTSKILWKQNNLLNKCLTTPVLYKNYILVGDNLGYLYLLDQKDGSFLFQKKMLSKGFVGIPIIVSDKIIIQSKDHNLHAFSFLTGN